MAVKIEKTIVNCGSRDGFAQLSKSKPYFSKLLKDCNFKDIRKKQPEIPENASPEEIEVLRYEQGMKNINEMIDVFLQDQNIDTFYSAISPLLFLTVKEAEEASFEILLDPVFKVMQSKVVKDFLLPLMR